MSVRKSNIYSDSQLEAFKTIRPIIRETFSDELCNDSLLEQIEFVEDFYKQGNNELPAQLVIYYTNGENDEDGKRVIHEMAHVMPEGFGEDHKARWATLRALGEKFMKDGDGSGKKCAPLAVFSNVEAWMVEKIPNEVPLDEVTRPSEDPNRIEIVASAGMTMDNRHNGAFFKIMRNEDGQLDHLAKYKTNPFMDDEDDESMKTENILLGAFWEGCAMAGRKSE